MGIKKIYRNNNGNTKLAHELYANINADSVSLYDVNDIEVEMEVGGVYYFKDVNRVFRAKCIYKSGNSAIMLSYGVNIGAWPGSGTLSVPTCFADFSSAMSNFRLPTGSSTSNIAVSGASGEEATSDKLLSILKSAASGANSLRQVVGVGTFVEASWLGTQYNTDNAYYISWSAYFGNRAKTNSLVIAPAFNLDLTKVKINPINVISLK